MKPFCAERSSREGSSAAAPLTSDRCRRASALGVDFVVWSEDLSPWVGNPLAIELRQNVLGGADVSVAVGRLTQAMARRQIPWGLFIHGRSTLDVWNAIAVPNILSISSEDFIERLRTTSFGELVWRLRNQRVHGGSYHALV